MDDEAHVGLVDAHAESIGSRNNLHLDFHPQVLSRVACLTVQTSVIERRRDAHRIEPVGDDLRAFAVAHIHDGAAFCHGFQLPAQHTVFVGLMEHIVGHVLALETTLEYVFLFETKAQLNVVHYFGRCCGGQSQNRRIRHVRPDFRDFQIWWTKIVAPL